MAMCADVLSFEQPKSKFMRFIDTSWRHVETSSRLDFLRVFVLRPVRAFFSQSLKLIKLLFDIWSIVAIMKGTTTPITPTGEHP